MNVKSLARLCVMFTFMIVQVRLARRTSFRSLAIDVSLPLTILVPLENFLNPAQEMPMRYAWFASIRANRFAIYVKFCFHAKKIDRQISIFAYR